MSTDDPILHNPPKDDPFPGKLTGVPQPFGERPKPVTLLCNHSKICTDSAATTHEHIKALMQQLEYHQPLGHSPRLDRIEAALIHLLMLHNR